jgi:hypothetical protein
MSHIWKTPPGGSSIEGGLNRYYPCPPPLSNQTPEIFSNFFCNFFAMPQAVLPEINSQPAVAL